MKQTEPNPWDLIDTKYRVGDIIHGKVRNITDFGAFVEVEEGVDRRTDAGRDPLRLPQQGDQVVGRDHGGGVIARPVGLGDVHHLEEDRGGEGDRS